MRDGPGREERLAIAFGCSSFEDTPAVLMRPSDSGPIVASVHPSILAASAVGDPRETAT